ncbi:lipase maturation factor 2, partial [Poecile atricapillus]|uniref:lipase maturation factor 2 n=1 Tax=Poecile atricapillus TaxID=48891 RepID=UPI0027384E98
MAGMAEAAGPRALFLGGLAAVYTAAFGSLYLQIPGLYGAEGLLPAVRLLRELPGQGLWERLRGFPTLLWLCPHLGLDTEQGMELLCVLGVLGSLGALLCPSLRHCLLFALLRMFYLSLYQVGQVFLYFQWDSLLLEAGFLAVLVAPLKVLPGGTPGWQPQHGVPLWGVRWLLFRLLFQSGVVKLSSRCPTWWGLTALTHHFESQCLPTPGAWLAHQLPLWLLKLAVVATLVIEVAVPLLFLAPLRRLRLWAFYCQVLLQTLIILTGNYNFFNALTIVLCFSLLDQQHLQLWMGRARRPHGPRWPPRPGWLLARLLEVATLGALLLGTARCFGLRVHGGVLEANVAFTHHEFSSWLDTVTLPLLGVAWLSPHHEFSSWLDTVTLPLLGVAFLSLSWEILVALYR